MFFKFSGVYLYSNRLCAFAPYLPMKRNRRHRKQTQAKICDESAGKGRLGFGEGGVACQYEEPGINCGVEKVGV